MTARLRHFPSEAACLVVRLPLKPLLTALLASTATLVAMPAQAETDITATDALAGGLRIAPTQIIELPMHQPRVLKLDLTRTPDEIWDRVRRGFGIPDLDSALVVEWQAFYLNRPKFLRTVFQRGGQYLYFIVDELEKRGMPTELALLPMVESSYNPLARSPSQASGLWQFIPSTGRNFDLAQNSWVDERRDVIASTHAALDYLEYLYEMHGDWQLALASYNWGEGAVGRAIKRNREAGRPTDYMSLEMPEQTRNYIPKLQSLKNIVANPELFGFELPYVPNDQHFTTVDVPRGMDLNTAARMADMSLEDFVALNPGYNKQVVHAEDDFLVVPTDRAERFRLRLSEYKPEPLRPQAAQSQPQTQQSQSQLAAYRVRQGDTLSAIARKYGTSVAQLRSINSLGNSNRLSIGQTLLVPRAPTATGTRR
ncbi:MAG: transglycosylase SLT domain-containing protein [Rhodocyclaceae bacterium]|nr:transglycosylase SLT domain-containing protein [Rhodocyclaceae bacterium]